ncbi:MAG: type II toxin-antitoxin system RelE/ParE family toxin [Spirochaetales bacterium]|nr:type II toxin-antitoxin system RelE/ParE family toxin [Spirochaetales bacterium]
MAWTIEFAKSAAKQLKKTDKQTAVRILKFMNEKVKKDPRSVGEALHANLADFWKYRIGDYRLICEIQDGKLVVLVLKLGHRREVYR